MLPRSLAVLLVSLLFCTALAADTLYKPFVLASINDAGLDEQTNATVAALESAGFTLAGRYSPVPNANVIVVTRPELQAIAAQSERGGYGAAQRIGITERDGKTEVSFVNPLYIQFAYRLEGNLQGIYDQLSKALGNVETFGSEKGLTAKKLGKYHYMVAMQRFDDPSQLGSFDSHAAAVAAVEQGLAREGDALTQVYRIDLPDKQQTVFGVGMNASGQSDDEVDIDAAHQLSIVDFEGYSKVAYFPYEVLVNGNEVEALHMRFRMAVHFPDLSMMGEHGFTKLIAAPGATEDALEAMLVEE
ncbi:MAG: hypothetical protein OQK01_07055 [Xanthomonadales bacterium]|jgi:hypothetical protein|nr:hypothetical protein [Xanthomonadales bacterium]